jgi:hypothetical protein
VNLHWFALPRDDVPDSLLDVLILPQPARAPMARPSLSIPSVNLQTVQTAAGIRTYACFHDHMHVIGSHMRRPEIPPRSKQTSHRASSTAARRSLSRQSGAWSIGWRFTAARSGAPVHRTGFMAVQMDPITSERDEVPHSGRFRNRSFTVAARLDAARLDAARLDSA